MYYAYIQTSSISLHDYAFILTVFQMFVFISREALG